LSKYFAKVSWNRAIDEEFSDNKYSRGHEWIFDGGLTIPASSSPHIVPLPYSIETNVDPEEAFVASLSSCHMLFFLSIAAKRKYVVDSYVDDSVGVVNKDSEGKLMVSTVTLHPLIRFSGDKRPTPEQIEKMHHLAHSQCFIANSVKTKVEVESQTG